MKSSFKKATVFLLAAAMLAILFAGCGSQETETTAGQDNLSEPSSAQSVTTAATETLKEESQIDFGGRQIKYGGWWDLAPVAGSSPLEDKLIQRVKDLESRFNFQMAYVNVPYDQYSQKVTASVMAGDPVFDIGYFEDGMFYPGLVGKGYLYPVSDLNVFDFNAKKWNKTTAEFGTYKDKIYGFGTEVTQPHSLILFNRKIFEKEGIPVPYELQNNNEWTWDKMLEIARKTTKDTKGDGVTDQWGMAGAEADMMFVYANNGSFFEMKDGKPTYTLGESNALEGLQFFQDLAQKEKVYLLPPDNAQWDYPLQQFETGNVAMFAGAYWMVDARFKDTMKDDYGILVFPRGPKADGYRLQTQAINVWAMPNNVKDPDKLAVMWDMYTEPLDPDSPAEWKDAFISRCRDSESMATFELLFNNGDMTVHNPIKSFMDIQNLWWASAYNIMHGFATPKAEVEKNIQTVQKIIEDTLNGLK